MLYSLFIMCHFMFIVFALIVEGRQKKENNIA